MRTGRGFALGLSAGLATALIGVLAVSGAAPSGERRPGSPLGAVRVVNLAHTNDPETTTIFPGDPAFELETLFTVEEDGFYLQYAKEGEHTGTHWAAPCHFHAGAACADDLEPRDLYLPAIVMDVRAQAASDADYEVSVADLRHFEARHGRIPNGAAVIAWTGWGEKWGTPAYLNLDEQGNVHQPGFSLEAVRWLVRTGRLGRRGALGTDTFGPDPATDTHFRESSLLLRRHRIDFENLTNLDALPPTGAYVLVGAPINDRGSGSTGTIWGLVLKS